MLTIFTEKRLVEKINSRKYNIVAFKSRFSISRNSPGEILMFLKMCEKRKENGEGSSRLCNVDTLEASLFYTKKSLSRKWL